MQDENALSMASSFVVRGARPRLPSLAEEAVVYNLLLIGSKAPPDRDTVDVIGVAVLSVAVKIVVTDSRYSITGL